MPYIPIKQIVKLEVALEEYLIATGYVTDIEQERRAVIVALCEITGDEIPAYLQQEEEN